MDPSSIVPIEMPRKKTLHSIPSFASNPEPETLQSLHATVASLFFSRKPYVCYSQFLHSLLTTNKEQQKKQRKDHQHIGESLAGLLRMRSFQGFRISGLVV